MTHTAKRHSPTVCPLCRTEGTFVMWNLEPYGQIVATSGDWPVRVCSEGHRWTVNGLLEDLT